MGGRSKAAVALWGRITKDWAQGKGGRGVHPNRECGVCWGGLVVLLGGCCGLSDKVTGVVSSKKRGRQREGQEPANNERRTAFKE